MKNHKDDNLGEFQGFYEFTLYMNFDDFRKMGIPMMGIYVKNLKII